MIEKLLLLSRSNKKLLLIIIDAILLITVLFISYSIRLDQWYFPQDDTIRLILFAPVIGIPIFAKLGLYQSVIRFIDLKVLWSLVQAVSLYALIWGLAGFFAQADIVVERGFNIGLVPRSVIVINWLLSLLAIGGIRIFARFIVNENIKFSIFNYEFKSTTKNINSVGKSRVLIYGAGQAGVQLSLALNNSNEFYPVGFIDDNKDLQGNDINGLEVYSINNIEELISKFKVEEVLIALPSASRSDQFNIIDKLERYPVIVRSLPGLSDIAQGKIKIDDLLQVSIKDLLGRQPVEPNDSLLGKNITNKSVVVTGAGGSIGSELCRQIADLKPKKLILFEASELALYTIDRDLTNANKYRSFDIFPILGSVTNKKQLKSLFEYFSVDTIYHAAAFKHVPMIELNNIQGVQNNIFGTLSCAQAAIDSGVKTFVLISTDKAVRPTNTMGATKRIAELILQAFAVIQNVTTFSMVRFGNVLGSSGSVIPLFKKQIIEGGPITVTDKDIIRYFMTVTEAVELLIQAGAMGTGGDVFVLDMGKPVKIKELAEKMIRLSGLKVKDEFYPNGDIEIKYTGLRAGEKLYEELLIGDNVSETDNPLIMRAKEEKISWDELKLLLGKLGEANDSLDYDAIRKILIKIVPGFEPQNEISDILYKNKMEPN